jgi:D-alanyl-D-alanine carboxypeptidase/D-alanyl-D-alanine-endopeptidase (penicillin-binding protein 4)
VVSVSRVIDATSEPASASESITSPSSTAASSATTAPRLATPVLSARRVVDELIEPVGQARLRDALLPLASSMGATSCLRVTIDGDEIVDSNGTVPLIPASTLKLLTASVALDILGADRTAETSVQVITPPVGGVIAGDVWLVGGGDPLLATEGYVKQFRRPQEPRTPLESLADSIVAAGVTQITGRVLGDESRFDTQRYVPSWPQRYINAREIGPMSALSVNDGFIDSALTPAADPAASAAAELVGLLQQRGVTVGGSGSGAAPEGTVELAAIEGAPLRDVVGEDLRLSDNGTSELLLKEIGLAAAGTGSTLAGAAAVVTHLTEAGMPVDGLTVNDGSGLDRGNTATCELLTAVLDAAGPGSDLTAQMAVAGESGTLDTRFDGTVIEGKVIAKTGSLSGVVGLAGFAEATDGTDVTFAVLLNGPQSDQGFAIWMSLLTTLIEYPNLAGLEQLGPRAPAGG